MNLVWKLLRQHISVPQFVGFFLADLIGMLIVLFACQFYFDIRPIFTAEDSFMKSDYMIVNKRVGMASALGGNGAFSVADTEDLSRQPFVRGIGSFSSTNYQVQASMSIGGVPVLKSEIFFESVPDQFVDAPLDLWKYEPESREVPIILPKSYLTMYNLGFAPKHLLPKISDGSFGMIDFRIFIHGEGLDETFSGRVIGFTNRLSTILVPQSFMDWSNGHFSSKDPARPTRLIFKVDNPTDMSISQYMESHGYEVSSGNENAEKINYFLRLLVSIVVAVGLIISALAIYILMLSIYLLVEKNATKLENLLLIGYSPSRVARPYQLLAVGLGSAVLLLAWAVILAARFFYMDMLMLLYPEMQSTSLWPMVAFGLGIFAIVSLVGTLVIRSKMLSIWKSHK